jgi:drug/metabolite transporter (DMT)-like permease
MKDVSSSVATIKPKVLHQNIFKGVMLVMLGLLLFACMDTTTKYLAERHNVPFVIAIRYIVQCFIMFLIFAPTYSTHLLKTQRTGLVIVRSLSLCCASLFVGLALKRQQLVSWRP